MVSGYPPPPCVLAALDALRGQGWVTVDDAAAATGRSAYEIGELLVSHQVAVAAIHWRDDEMPREARMVHLESLRAAPRRVRLRSV